jgi:hypothetical protein
MILLELNPEAGRESSEFQHETFINADGSTTYRGRIFPKLTPDRWGRWGFQTMEAGGRDIVVEEWTGVAMHEVARFSFDQARRIWTGPEGSDIAFWKKGRDSWIGAMFTDYPR